MISVESIMAEGRRMQVAAKIIGDLVVKLAAHEQFIVGLGLVAFVEFLAILALYAQR